MTWCCSDHSGRQVQCTVVVEFQVRDFFVNLKVSTIRERITLNQFQFQFKVPGDGVILCPSYYTVYLLVSNYLLKRTVHIIGRTEYLENGCMIRKWPEEDGQ